MKRIGAYIFLYWVFSFHSFAQNIEFSHLGLDEGLSQISVNTLFQDEYGQIWIGTRDGLNLYDGNQVRVFYPERGDTTGLPNSHIRKICGDLKGTIYIKAADALVAYEIHRQQFRTLIHKDIIAIGYANNQLLVSTKKEILKFRPEKQIFDTLYSFKYPLTVVSIWQDSNRNIWIGEENGIFRLSNDGQFQTMVPNVKATSIYEDSKHNIWIGTWENGVYIFREDGSSQNLRAGTLSSNFVRDICEDNQGNYWIGTFNGLNLYNPLKKTVTAYYPGKEASGSLSHSSIWCILKDSQGSIWAGTYFGGVNYFNPEYAFYQHYISDDENPQSLSSPIVGKMVEDKNHNLWICTEGGGLNFFNRKTNTFKSYRHQPENPNSISHNNLKSIWYDEEKDLLWIGTHTGGLNRFDIRKETFRTYRKNKNDPSSLPDDIVKDIIPYKEQLLLATYNGVCLFDPETGKSTILFPKEKYGYDIHTVLKLLIDTENRLWFSVYGEGVFCYDSRTDHLKNYRYEEEKPNSINSLGISNIFQDHKFRLWFGSAENGLNLYRPETDDFISFDMQNSGLISNHIVEILESRYGYLLVATGHGFSRFDIERGLFYNYNKKNGFPLSTINDGAAYITKDGEIFLGGVTGLVSFYEKELNKLNKPYHINLERLLVNNREVKPGDGSHILSESILTAGKINLNHDHSVFTIEFSTSNYIPSNKKELEYRLIGFNEQWIDAGSRNDVTYTNLDPGEYRLEVREKQIDGLQKPVSKSILINIAPPFYRTWYAYLMYVALILFITWWLINYFRTKALLVLEKKEKRQIEDLNQQKLRFFTNISHEFRTPISLIMGQTEMLLEIPNLPPKAYNKALSIYKNSGKMKNLIAELIDFRKQEQGFMKLRVARQDIVVFINEIYLSFKENADYRQIRFSFQTSCPSAEIWFDGNQMLKVFNNLISNAFKYTHAGDSIDIIIQCNPGDIEIWIKDTGIGISKEGQDKVFDRFYQEENKKSSVNTGSGIGLALAKGIVELHKGNIRVESELDHGSTFIVTLPRAYSFAEGEVVAEEADSPIPKFTTDPFDTEQISSILEELPDSFRNNQPKIFIAEDNDELREMLTGIFAPLYEVKTMADGENAFEMIREWQPDIVLSDIMMPKVSGTELCAHLKSDMETSHIPVVLLTAQTDIEHNIEGLRLGADDYITKPFNIRILITRCNNLVNGRRILQEKFGKQPVFSSMLVATNPLDKEVIEKAQAIVEKYLDDSEFDINAFAREMALGRTKLFAKIKGITGQTPNEFILNIKLKKGAFWLKNVPGMSLADIAYSLGFSSTRYFSKCFKETFGIAPLLYRKGETGSSDDEEIE